MKVIKEIIIVEGIHDIAFLRTFLDARFIKTDGTSLPNETIELIKNLKDKGEEFIILTDPDYPGSYIRSKLLTVIPDAKIGFIRKKEVRTKGSIGVENATKEEILKALDSLVTFKELDTNKITRLDLIELGLDGNSNSSKLREKITDVLMLGKCNSKTFLYRINHLDMSKDEIIKKLKEIING